MIQGFLPLQRQQKKLRQLHLCSYLFATMNPLKSSVRLRVHLLRVYVAVFPQLQGVLLRSKSRQCGVPTTLYAARVNSVMLGSSLLSQQRGTAHSLDCSSKESLLNAIMQEEDVQFQWCMMTTTIQDASASTLLRMLCEHYVTIRGYSFAGSCVELYKKSSKRALQKGKGLRKELFSSRV